MLGGGERDDEGSKVATERRSIGIGEAELEAPGAGEVDGGVGVDEPPCWKRACKFRGGFVASAGSEPKAFGAPLLNAGGAAGEDESVAFLSLAVPKATVERDDKVSTVS